MRKEDPYSKFLKDQVWQMTWIGIGFVEGCSKC
jgi:hypothetical protein